MMSSPKSTKVSYEALSSELEAIMLELQRDDLDIDLAIKHYERGLELIKALENYLKTAENKISELKATFATDK